MAFSVQTFLAWRLFKVTHSLVLTALVCAGAVTAFGECLVCAGARRRADWYSECHRDVRLGQPCPLVLGLPDPQADGQRLVGVKRDH
jgi:hypothetical protein